ncbi:MAG: hypothetical protein IJ658_00105 [Kiritimatiellae bacterium]|nr:hypothetical protein [Kiritimatiellia bacterium]
MKRTLATMMLAACVAAFAETAEEDVSPDTTTNDVIVIDVPAMTNDVVVAAETNNVVVRDAVDIAAWTEANNRRRISTRTFKLVHASAEEVAERFNNTWGGDFGITWKIKQIAQAFPEANSVMVTAPGVILEACEKVIRDIDVEAPQVYIEARFVELNNSALHKLGIDWSMLEGMKGTMSISGGFEERKFKSGISEYKTVVGSSAYDNTSYSASGKRADMSYFNGTLSFSDMSLVLSALERNNDVKIFSNPKILVSNGRKAMVDMTTKYPNVTVSAKRTLNGNAESLDLAMSMTAIPGKDTLMFANEAFFSWGISLEVTPRIETNGLINVSIVPTISSLDTTYSSSGFVTADDNSDSKSPTYSSKYPIIEVQRLVTEFAMSSGTTAVIGGLSKTTEESVDSGIPWLRDWPWVGNKLFGGKSRQKVQKEILVFVTVGMADSKNMPEDVGLPKNAVLGRTYTQGYRQEPGDRTGAVEGLHSLDLRSLEDQASDPGNTNHPPKMTFPVLFQKK